MSSKLKKWMTKPGLRLAASMCQASIDAHEEALAVETTLSSAVIESHMLRQEVCRVLKRRFLTEAI